MSADFWLAIAAVVVFIITSQYEVAYLMGMVAAFQFAREYGEGV